MTHPQPIAERQETAKACRHEHVYAIVRVDDFLGPDAPINQKVTVKKVIRDAAIADREVERLNALQHGEGVYYFSQVTRMEKNGPEELSAPPANRIGALAQLGAPLAISEDKRAFLESITVPPFIDLPYPKGWGFPAIRALEVCAVPTNIHEIRWNGVIATIYSKSRDGYVEVVGVMEIPEGRSLGFAFKAFPDLCKTPLAELTPLEIVEQFANRFGLTVSIGGKSGKFFLQREFPIPTILIPGIPEGQLYRIDNPRNHPFVVGPLVKIDQPLVRVAILFCADTAEYVKWLGSH